MSQKNLTGMAFAFNTVTDAVSKIANGIGAVISATAEMAESVAIAENAWGSYDGALQALAATGNAMTIDTFSKFTTILRNTGLEINLTGQQIDKIGGLAASMGKDSDEAFEEFAKSIAKGNLEGLQGIGIYTNMEIELRKAAKASGRSTDSFSHQERQTLALSVATRELENATVRGGQAFAQMDQLGRNVSNTWSQLKERALVPLGEYLATNINILFEQFGSSGVKSGIQIQAEMAQLKKQVSELAPDVDRVMASFRSYQRQGRDAERRTEELLSQSQIIAKINKAQREIEDSIDNQSQNEAAYKKTKADIVNLNEKAAKLEKQIEETREKAGKSMRARYAQLQTTIESQGEKLLEIERERAELMKRSGGSLQERSRLNTEERLAKERIVEAERSAGELINQMNAAKKEAEIEVAKVREQITAINDKNVEQEKALKALKKSKLSIEQLHKKVVTEQVGLLQTLAQVQSQANQQATTHKQTALDILRTDLERFGKTKSGLNDIATLESQIYNARRKQAIEDARNQLQTLKLEKARLKTLAAQSMVNTLSAESKAQNLRAEAALVGSSDFERSQELIKASKLMDAQSKAQIKAHQAAKDAADATDATINAAQDLLDRLLKTRQDTPANVRRRMRRTGGASKAQPQPETVAIEGIDGLSQKRVAVEQTLLELDEERAIAADNFTLQTRLQFLNRRAAVEQERISASLDNEKTELQSKLTTLQQQEAKLKQQNKLSEEQAWQFAWARSQITEAINLSEQSHNARSALAAAKAQTASRQAQKDARDQIERKLKAVRSEMGLLGPMERAREREIEHHKEILRLKLLGLSAEQERALIEQINSEKRIAFFETLNSHMANAAQMASQIDQMAQSYASLADASGTAGDVQLSAGQKTTQATAKFLLEFQRQQGAINKTIDLFSAAQGKGTKEYAAAAESAISTGGALAASLIDDEQTKAAVLAAMEAAAAVAAFAAGNVAGGIGHTAAAGLYAAVAGTAKQGTSTPSETDALQVRAEGGELEQSAGQMIVNINAPVISGTHAETGAMIGQWIEEAKGAGYGG